MQYIVYDLEFNQDFSSYNGALENRSQYPSEIIQIGAVKLDSDFRNKGNFNRYVKPTIYSNISPFITELINQFKKMYDREMTEEEQEIHIIPTHILQGFLLIDPHYVIGNH